MDTRFEYKPDFTSLKVNGIANKFSASAVIDGKPTKVGSLEWYYSANNRAGFGGTTAERELANELAEVNVPETSSPYSRTIYYDDGSGEVLTTVGADEYHFESTTSHPLKDEVGITDMKGIFDVHFKPEPITSADTLVTTYLEKRATLLGLSTTPSLVGKGYKQRNKSYEKKETITYFDGDGHEIINIFKGVEAEDITQVFVFYDTKGRVKLSLTPKGTDALISGEDIASVEGTRYFYNRRGWLLRIVEPDAGETKYKYRNDGLIRFSQNALQALNNRCSYTNYDEWGRPIESGEILNFNFNNITESILERVVSFDDTNNDGLITLHDTFSDGLNAQNKKVVTRTFYDNPSAYLENEQSTTQLIYAHQKYLDFQGNNFIAYQKYLESAVSYSEYIADVPAVISGSPTSATDFTERTFYSYDERGRVTWMSQQIPGLGFKTISYLYGGRSEVVEVSYQKGAEDQFHHYYVYDKNGGLKEAYAGKDCFLKERSLNLTARATDLLSTTLQARYHYYKHGGLKKMELAPRMINDEEIPLQTIDYVYTLQGALKGINKSNDGNQVIEDVFEMQLQYFQGDYVNTQNAIPAITNVENHYDGQIYAATWNGKSGTTTINGAYKYSYDYKGQLKNANFGSVNGNTFTSLSKFSVSNLDYDKNGNIENLQRNNSTGGSLHHFDYDYDPIFSNRLKEVKNVSNNSLYSSYEYDAIGQLEVAQNFASNTTQMPTFNTMGYMTSISDGNEERVKYAYNTLGFRSLKENRSSTGVFESKTYYVRDASGKVIAIYTQPSESDLPELAEVPIYGASRLGVQFRYQSAPELFQTTTDYQLSDHLGNVRATVNWEQVNIQTPSIETNSYSDYYPFGFKMNIGLTQGSRKYRYGYQGNFAEDEMDDNGFNSFEARMYDPVIGRWLSVDPARQFASGYVAMGNNPVMGVDPDGRFSNNGEPPVEVKKGDCNCSVIDEEGNFITYFKDVIPLGFQVYEPIEDPLDFLLTFSPIGLRSFNNQTVDWDGKIMSEKQILTAPVPNIPITGLSPNNLPIIMSMQKGLRHPAVVDDLIHAMTTTGDDIFRYTAPEGRIAGYLTDRGVYVINSGNHRVVAAKEIFSKTGNLKPLENLLKNGIWSPSAGLPASARPMPS
ncbi:RHS repeat-associated core domain-containing protein [Flammeovirga sp. EKP202]|uniref:RHS repeat-associated core domain-containing protein n=1 Tax=Flammeovirga sp. EKP202 TaxID=2770592 RepID=UPI00165EFA81|nr:RHS repeat-associated core domain-containing protein [Flammeovirga sp. EKP202]MBD0405126.1 hypothetical protein [Flammeovirga sp. EKP202]